MSVCGHLGEWGEGGRGSCGGKRGEGGRRRDRGPFLLFLFLLVGVVVVCFFFG